MPPKSPGSAVVASWYRGKSFTSDWTSGHFPHWIRLLSDYRDRKLNVLEIGSWEGRSALFFLNYLKQCELVCVDTFKGSDEHQRGITDTGDVSGIEARFDANTAQFRHRLQKIKAESRIALADLGLSQRRFDIVYVDGSHLALDVYTDAVLAWPLIVSGGLMIFDDYEWDMMREPTHHPKIGIDAFLDVCQGEYRVLLKDYQVAIVKARNTPN